MDTEFERIWLELQGEANQRQRERIAANPKGHKLTLVMRDHCRTRSFTAGLDGWGRSIAFGYTTGRNQAGYFLSFRTVFKKDGTGKRDRWAARKVRHRAAALARARTERFREKHGSG